ncbi:pro-resilin-like [Oratosquilla oratoria]|uniref:pro-resilin-like n=1 Tax=Oratosquilla oratoria TaxID=337810 RepID=UPI003F765ACF
MDLKLVFIASMLAMVQGSSFIQPGYNLPRPLPPPPPPRPSSYQPYGPTAPARYDFDWAVNDAASGNNFGHQESRDGDHTQGSYYVLLPDGRLQRVNYNVQGNSGFVAEVTYEGSWTMVLDDHIQDLLFGSLD